MADETPPSILAQWGALLPGARDQLAATSAPDLDDATEKLQVLYRAALGEMELRAALASMRGDTSVLDPYPSLYALTEALSDPAERAAAEGVLERFLTPPPELVEHLEYGPDLMAAIDDVRTVAGAQMPQVIAEAKTAAIADFVVRIEQDIAHDVDELTAADPTLDR